MRGRHRLVGAVLLVAVGRLLSPFAVPVYDGIGAPDEPYRFVAPPSGSPTTAAATSVEMTSPIAAGVATNGMSVATAEQGPQFSLYLPPKAFAGQGSKLVVRAVPQAPVDQPPKAHIDGNVYLVTATAGAGPVTRTPQAALATLYMRATTAKQPGPVFEYRAAPTDPWTAVKTNRGGNDIYVAGFQGPGQYALAFLDAPPGEGTSALIYVSAGLLVLLIIVVVVRVRAPA